MLWVGMPPMAGSQLDGEMNLENGLARSEAAARPERATYLSSRNVLGDGQGNYTAYLTNGSGSEVNIRTPDGIHLTLGGGEVAMDVAGMSFLSSGTDIVGHIGERTAWGATTTSAPGSLLRTLPQ